MTEQHFETTSPTAGNNLAYTSLELFCIFDVVLLLWFFNISGSKQLSSMNPTQKGVMYISLVQSYRQNRMGLHLDKRVEKLKIKGSVKMILTILYSTTSSLAILSKITRVIISCFQAFTKNCITKRND